MTKQEFDKSLIESGNNYRCVLTIEQAEYIRNRLPAEKRPVSYEGKCGGCKYATPRKVGKCKSYVYCTCTEKKFRNEYTRLRTRSEKGCNQYERSKQLS